MDKTKERKREEQGARRSSRVKIVSACMEKQGMVINVTILVPKFGTLGRGNSTPGFCHLKKKGGLEEGFLNSGSCLEKKTKEQDAREAF